ncbi:DUF6683 family protein [Arhodomonas sp. AD133]|uniref:DUF6683 family protein n=1 Tax=Arhodomonas sp. AD133 TaxID=3415009 RepID=UPI003EC0EE44
MAFRLLTFSVLWLVCGFTPGLAQSGGMGGIMSEVFDATLEGKAAAKDVPEGRASFFVPQEAISRKVREQMLAKVIAKAPQKERQIREAFGKIDVVAYFNRVAVDLGYEPNDLAVALSAWVTVSFGILDERETTEAEDRAVWRQFRRVINGNPKLANLSNAEKQTVAEILMWTAAMSQHDYEQARAGTPGYDLDKVKAYVRENLAQFHLDPERFTVTNLGITPVASAGGESRATAADPEPSGYTTVPVAKMRAVSETIEAVAFMDVYRGGGSDTAPVLLFVNGDACTDMGFLSSTETVEAHKAAHPEKWTKWRRHGGTLQILKSKGWSDFPYQSAYGPLEEGYRLSRRYKRSNFISSGAGDWAAASNTYEFHDDGTFTHGRSAVANSSVSDTSATVASVPDDQRGEYYVDGYYLTLSYANGERVVKAIVTDDPEKAEVIWLDGYSYVDY